ncbi:MAG: FkbM family methyltransferase [Azospirillaceae bacterium]|nr:FkbM family methyltransferase [Azospirillaceae bacterium]
MNNGDDTEYFIKKGYRVIAIEANPELCKEAAAHFRAEIAGGLLKILNIGVGKEEGILDFYIDTQQSTTSTFAPQPNEGGRYRIMPVAVKRLSGIIMEEGMPDLLKVDVEGLDYDVLEDLYKRGIQPVYLSAEAHTIDVFCMLVCMGYDQFKVMDSGNVGRDFAAAEIHSLDGKTLTHHFKYNSSGPFGDDFPAAWQGKVETIRHLATLDTTWRDIHARNTKALYAEAARKAGVQNPAAEIKLAYGYWRRYPDVAGHDYYGEFGTLGYEGARRHFIDHGRTEGRRLE